MQPQHHTDSVPLIVWKSLHEGFVNAKDSSHSQGLWLQKRKMPLSKACNPNLFQLQLLCGFLRAASRWWNHHLLTLSTWSFEVSVQVKLFTKLDICPLELKLLISTLQEYSDLKYNFEHTVMQLLLQWINKTTLLKNKYLASPHNFWFTSSTPLTVNMTLKPEDLSSFSMVQWAGNRGTASLALPRVKLIHLPDELSFF